MRKIFLSLFALIFCFASSYVYSETYSEKSEKYAIKVLELLKAKDFENYWKQASILKVKDNLNSIFPTMTSDKYEKKLEQLKAQSSKKFSEVIKAISDDYKINLDKVNIIGVDCSIRYITQLLSTNKKPIKVAMTLFFSHDNKYFRLRIRDNCLVNGEFYFAIGADDIEEIGSTKPLKKTGKLDVPDWVSNPYNGYKKSEYLCLVEAGTKEDDALLRTKKRLAEMISYSISQALILEYNKRMLPLTSLIKDSLQLSLNQVKPINSQMIGTTHWVRMNFSCKQLNEFLKNEIAKAIKDGKLKQIINDDEKAKQFSENVLKSLNEIIIDDQRWF